MSTPIAIVDCNNFYASCEQSIDKQWEGKPLVVLSNNDGVIIALSNEAKKLGIDKFTPFFKVKNLLIQNGAKICSANFQLYANKSTEVMNVIRCYSPDVEEYSIDEAFVDLRGFSRFNLTEYMTKMRNEIYDRTGIMTTVGIATTKTLSKIANRYAKKQTDYRVGVLDISNEDERIKYLKLTDIGDVWGIGRGYKKLLNENNIHTAFEFVMASQQQWMKKKMSVVGQRTAYELQGIACVDMKYEYKPKKMIMFSRSFGKKLTNKEDIIEAVALFTARAAERMRTENSSARFVSLYLNSSRYEDKRYYEKYEMRLPTATDSTGEILSYTIKAVDKCYMEGVKFYQAGVMLSGLQPTNSIQVSFFDTYDRHKIASVTKAVDNINLKNGIDTIKYASMGTKNSWKQNQNYRTKDFVESDKLLVDIKRQINFL